MAEEKGSANEFIKQYGPIAEKIGAELNVDPKIILAQFGLETGWGKSIIPGTNNLGNIKDPTGQGVRARDEREKSNDAYLKFQSPEVFGRYYANFIKRMYPDAVGAGDDVDKFTQGLNTGVAGRYATAENYDTAVRNAYSLVNSRVAAMDKDEYPFGKGPTEAEVIKKEREEKGDEDTDTTTEPTSDAAQLDAALGGAGVGLLAGAAAKESRLPVSSKYEAAKNRLARAQVELDQLKQTAPSMSPADLEQEFNARKAAALKASEDFRIAQEELKSASRSTPLTAQTPAGGTPGEKWASKVVGQDFVKPGVQSVTEAAADYRRSIPEGKIAGRLYKKFNMPAASPTGQVMGIADRLILRSKEEARLASELAERQAQEAAERSRLTQQYEARRLAAEKRLEAARSARQQAGESKKDIDQAMKSAAADEKAISKAQRKVNVESELLKQAKTYQPGALARFGETTAKVLPKTLGVLSGAATGYTLAEAVNEWNKAYNAYQRTGEFPPLGDAVTRTIEAGFGAMSMLPPYSPLTAALRFIGTVGGLGMAGYEGYKAVRGEDRSQPSAMADVVAP